MSNSSTDRRWLQTAGLPLRPFEKSVRDALDRLDRAKLLESTNRVVLFDADFAMIGVLDLAEPYNTKLGEKWAATEKGEAIVADPQPGDTIIQPLDPSSPQAAALLASPRVYQAPEPIPNDLPDFEPEPGSEHYRRAPADQPTEAEREPLSPMKVALLALAAWAMLIATAAVINQL